MENEFYSVNEFAEILGVSTDRVYEWLRTGHIRGVRVTETSAWRIHRSEIERLRGEPQRLTEAISGTRLTQHFSKLSEIAEIIYYVQEYLACYKKEESFKVVFHGSIAGLFFFQPPPMQPPIDTPIMAGAESINCSQVECFCRHLNQEFPKLSLKDWRDLVARKLRRNVIERIRYLGNTAEFSYCPTCQVCKDLMT